MEFQDLDEPYMYGYFALRSDGIRVEVVRCYEGQWNVFMTAGGRVVARSIEEYRSYGNGYASKKEAMRIARNLMKGAN